MSGIYRMLSLSILFVLGVPSLQAYQNHQKHVSRAWVQNARPHTGPGHPDGGPGQPAQFGLYILALTWTPGFCCAHPTNAECKDLPPTFGGTHFTLHGLWPNYTDQETPSKGPAYPTYCRPYEDCGDQTPPSDCYPDAGSIPAIMAKYGPGYVTDNNYLADHEWPKHGSCTGLTSWAYFNAAIDQMLKLPGDQGTPTFVSDNIGKSVDAKELVASFGTPGTAMVRCDKHCNLLGVGVCLENGEDNRPGNRIQCPKNMLRSSYDNSCELNGCEKIFIQKAGDCNNGVTKQGSLGSPSGDNSHLRLDGAPAQGPDHAPVTLVAFSDFTCPFSEKASVYINRLRAEYGDYLRVVFKQVPGDGLSRRAAQASMAAFAQGDFWEMRAHLFANRSRFGRPNFFLEAAVALGLDLEQFLTDMDDPHLDAYIRADLEQAAQLGLTATPTFFVDGTRVNGADYQALKKAVAYHLNKTAARNSVHPSTP